MSTSLPEPSSRLPENFAVIIVGLSNVVAEACENRYFAPIAVLLWGRLQRMSERFVALLTLWRAGRLRPPRPRPPRPQGAHTRPKPERVERELSPKPPIPRGFGWLVKQAPHAAYSATLLQILLADPDMLQLLTEAPQAGRLLRPLCHMLGIPLIPQLRRPRVPRPRKPAPEQPPPDSASDAQPVSLPLKGNALRRYIAEHISPRRRPWPEPQKPPPQPPPDPDPVPLGGGAPGYDYYYTYFPPEDCP